MDKMDKKTFEKYFMYKEIFETPLVLEKLQRKRNSIQKIVGEIEAFSPDVILEVSRGTSDNAAIFGKYALEYTFNKHVSLAAFSLYNWYGRHPSLKNALVIAISQSGETEDVCKLVEKANGENGKTLGITNSKKSTLYRTAQHKIYLEAGKERSVAATKTYSATLAVFLQLAESKGVKVNFSLLIKNIETILKKERRIFEIAERYRFANDFIVIGRGFNFSTSQESALKLRETSQVNAVGFSAIDFLHGPLSSISPLLPVVFFIPEDETYSSNLSVLKKIKEANGDVLVVSDSDEALAYGDEAFKIPHGNTLTYPLINIVFSQMFAFFVSIVKRKNPDTPKLLKKITRGM
jgi:glucosamine--fructose-6-phosphate aminotransferase (isomerizing)